MSYCIPAEGTTNYSFLKTGMTSNGRHFRIAARDEGKPYADSYISSYFDQGFGNVEFVGQIEDIVRLNYDSLSVVLLKGKW